MLDITDQVKKDGFDLNKYYPMSIGQATYKGKLYGLPKDATPRMIYYNKKSFDDAKIPYPKDGWTWADFEATVKKLTRGTGTNAKYGFIVPAGFTYQMQGYIWGAGGDEISANGAKSTVNSSRGERRRSCAPTCRSSSSTSDRYSARWSTSCDPWRS